MAVSYKKLWKLLIDKDMLKKDLQEMSFRSFTLLFNEVCGEVDFTTVRPISMFGGKEIDHWIFKKKKRILRLSLEKQIFIK